MRVAIIAFSAIALAAVSPAAANDLVIQYDDLDLTSPKGQKILERRIESAARTYCGFDATQTGTRLKASGASECLSSARDAAREQMVALIKRQSAQKGG